MFFIGVVALEVVLFLLELLLVLKYLELRHLGSMIVEGNGPQGLRSVHFKAAKQLIALSGWLVVVVIVLEVLLRSDRNFIAPVSALLLVHLSFAATFLTCILLMRYFIHGYRMRRVHVALGKVVVPISLAGMVITGTILAIHMLLTAF